MNGNIDLMNDLVGSGVPMPTLFLLCQEMRVADKSWLGHIVSQCGFLSDSDDGIAHDFPINAQHWGVPIDISGEPVAAQMLREQVEQGAVSLAGLDIVPDARRCHVVALSLQRSPAVTRAQAVQRLAFLAAALVGPLGASTMFWPPAQLWSNANELADAVIMMEAQGLPPLLHFVAFNTAPTPSDGEHGIITRGLMWVVGHEIEVSAPLSFSRPELLRRAARLGVDVMANGAYSHAVTVPGLTKGEKIFIAAVDDDESVKIVRARIVSDSA